MLLGNETLDQALGGATTASLMPSDGASGTLAFMQLRAGIEGAGLGVQAPPAAGTSASFNRLSAAVDVSAPAAAMAPPALAPKQSYGPGNG